MPANRLQTGMRRTPRTAFRPGVSGNPRGRPKLTAAQRAQTLALMQACQQKTGEALAVITALMHTADHDRVRLAAAQYILDRGWGKTVQAMEHAGGGRAMVMPHTSVVEVVQSGNHQSAHKQSIPHTKALSSPINPISCDST